MIYIQGYIVTKSELHAVFINCFYYIFLILCICGCFIDPLCFSPPDSILGANVTCKKEIPGKKKILQRPCKRTSNES